MQTAVGRARAKPSGLSRPPQTYAFEPSLDTAIFSALAEALDRVVLAQIYREFLSQTRSRIEELSSRRDKYTRAALAHTIKGTAGMLGARSLATWAACLEHAEGEGETEKMLTAMLAACAALDAALRERQIAL